MTSERIPRPPRVGRAVDAADAADAADRLALHALLRHQHYHIERFFAAGSPSNSSALVDTAERVVLEDPARAGQVTCLSARVQPGISPLHVQVAEGAAALVWARRRAPGRVIGIAIGDPGDVPFQGVALYSPHGRTIVIDPARCADAAGSAGAGLFIASVIHEATHAAQHAVADRERRNYVQDTTAPSYRYVDDPEEADATREELAGMIALLETVIGRGTFDPVARVVRYGEGMEVPFDLIETYMGLMSESFTAAAAALEAEYAGRVENPARQWPTSIAEAAVEVLGAPPPDRVAPRSAHPTPSPGARPPRPGARRT